ncbi:hypothetical protein BDC45DRAFT_576700 [Circinella umbellata]|nr:hypothetical protein BDC45DRAFT_576700 [Circinella umbellata]
MNSYNIDDILNDIDIVQSNNPENSLTIKNLNNPIPNDNPLNLLETIEDHNFHSSLPQNEAENNKRIEKMISSVKDYIKAYDQTKMLTAKRRLAAEAIVDLINNHPKFAQAKEKKRGDGRHAVLQDIFEQYELIGRNMITFILQNYIFTISNSPESAYSDYNYHIEETNNINPQSPTFFSTTSTKIAINNSSDESNKNDSRKEAPQVIRIENGITIERNNQQKAWHHTTTPSEVNCGSIIPCSVDNKLHTFINNDFNSMVTHGLPCTLAARDVQI